MSIATGYMMPPLSPLCQAWLIQLCQQFETSASQNTTGPLVILRGFEHLPARAGFDLDMLLEAKDADILLQTGQEIAKELAVRELSHSKPDTGEASQETHSNFWQADFWQNGPLKLYSRKKSNGLKLVLFDLSFLDPDDLPAEDESLPEKLNEDLRTDNTHKVDPFRRWLLLDIQFSLKIGGTKLALSELELTCQQQDRMRFITPAPLWHDFLLLVQAARKNGDKGSRKAAALIHATQTQTTQDKNPSSLVQAFAEHDPDAAQKLGLAPDDLPALDTETVFTDKAQQPELSERTMTWLQDFAAMLGVKPYQSLSAPSASSAPDFKQRLARFVFFRLFFWHRHKPLFFCISGPDGVGKSTLADNILKIMQGYPFLLNSFHHTQLAKGFEKSFEQRAPKPQKTEPQKAEHTTSDTQSSQKTEPTESPTFKPTTFKPGLLWRLSRTVAPEPMRQLVRVFFAEYSYLKTLNQELGRDYFARRVSLADRYSYDRCLKMQLHDKSWVQRKMSCLTSRWLRPPRVLIVPVDEAQAIYRRKQELTPKQIDWYYGAMQNLAQHNGARLCLLSLAEYNRSGLAQQASATILDEMGPALFDAISSYEEDVQG